jgi:hypothetical protein
MRVRLAYQTGRTDASGSGRDPAHPTADGLTPAAAQAPPFDVRVSGTPAGSPGVRERASLPRPTTSGGSALTARAATGRENLAELVLAAAVHRHVRRAG